MARPSLNREQIVATAIEVADEGGLDAVTMRLVGQRLGASGMALYRHVAHRDALIEAMIDAVVGEYAYPVPRPPHWRDALAEMARQDWRSFFAHPWLLSATASARPALGPKMLAQMEWALAIFDDFDLTPVRKLHLLSTVSSYANGLAMTWTEPGATDSTQYWHDNLTGIGLTRLESILAQLGAGTGLDIDEQFEFGLQRVLDGIELYLKQVNSAGA